VQLPERYCKVLLWRALRCPLSALLPSQGFYTNHDGMMQDYYRLLDKLSSHFSTNPGVLGFDLFNEPLLVLVLTHSIIARGLLRTASGCENS
jgi:hypothetical protein